MRPTDQDNGDSCFPPEEGNTAITMKSGAVECNSVVGCLPTILEALGLIPSTVHIHTHATHMNISRCICSFRELMLEISGKRTRTVCFSGRKLD